MSSLTQFEPYGFTFVISAATTASTPIQVLAEGTFQGPQYLLTNAGSIDVFIGVGGTSNDATADTVVPVAGTPQDVLLVKAGNSIIYTLSEGSWFSGITATAGTATVYAQNGLGA